MNDTKWFSTISVLIIFGVLIFAHIEGSSVEKCNDNPDALKNKGLETEAYFFNHRLEERQKGKNKALFRVIDYVFCADSSVLTRTKILGLPKDRFERFEVKNLIFKIIYEKGNPCNHEINFYWELDSISNPCLKLFIEKEQLK
jgi:hypothetical protein